MSSSSGKNSSSSQKSLNYYGTLGGACCWGPLDWLKAVITNDGYLWQGNLDLTTDVTDLTGSIADPSLIAPGGYLKLYRGTETQPADPALVGHPPMKGTVVIVGKHLFFGQDSGTAPNFKIIGGRLPRVPTTIVAAVDNIRDDDQVNPVAALAEILLDERGCAMSEDDLDATSWLASGHWCAQDQAHRDFTFCSPLITDQQNLRAIVQQLMDPFNGFCRWTSDGKLACHIYEWGVDPGGLPLLDAQALIEVQKLSLRDWDSVPTEIVTSFTDRDYEYQENTVIVPNARAAQVRQTNDPDSLNRSQVTRLAQAHRQTVEYIRRVGTAPTAATCKVRRPFIEGMAVGDKLKLDTDPEPGGAGLAQIVRLDRIEEDGSDLATIGVLTDNLLPAVPYTPGWAPSAPAAPTSPAMVYFLGVPLPPVAFGVPRAVAILATRPSAAVIGMHVFFSDVEAGSYDELGQQIGFAVRATLQSAIADSDTTLLLTQTDGLSAPDAGLAANTPGGNLTTAEDNALLVLLCQLDVNGRIDVDGSGDPIMEFISIVERAPSSGATYSYDVLRGRLGTTARAWGAATVAWIVPRVNLDEWRHELFDNLAGSLAYFRLVSYVANAADETIPVPECAVHMLSATSPMYLAGAGNENIYFSFIFKRSASGTPTTPTGDTPAGWTDGPPSGTDPLYMSRGVKRLDTGALVGAWSTPVRIDGDPGTAGADGGFVDHVFKRATSTPSTPTGNGTPSGWSDGPPTGTDPLWMSTASKTAADVLVGSWSTPVRLDGLAGDSVIIEYSVDGATSWHSTFTSGDKYMRQKIGTGGSFTIAMKIVGEDGGDGGFVDYVFKRNPTTPSTPTGNGTPSGWSDGPPGGSDPLWFSTAVKTAADVLVGSWSTPQRLDGPAGLDGADGDSIITEYSVNGSSSWHSTFTGGDEYMRVKIGTGGTFTPAIKIVGEDGTDGDSVDLEWSVDGVTAWHYPFAPGDIYMRERLGSGAWSDPFKVVGEDGAAGGAVLGSIVGTANSSAMNSVYNNILYSTYLTVSVPAGQRTVTVSCIVQNNTTARVINFDLWRGNPAAGGTLIRSVTNIAIGATPATLPVTFQAVETPGAGSYDYYLRFKCFTAFSDLDIDYSVVVT